MKVKCPACGARGTDVEPELAPDDEKDLYGFEVYGHDGGRQVRKCLNCGGGVYVKLLPPRYVAIPPDRWAAMQEYFDAQMAELDARREAFRQQSREEQGG